MAADNIECFYDVTIYLTDGKTNTVNGNKSAPANVAGIQIGGAGTTLTINAETAGTGILNVTGGDDGAGIGTGWAFSSNIEGGNITINGGVINATGGKWNGGAAGIGTGYARNANNKCGAITIGSGITNVTAKKGDGAAWCIGMGPGMNDPAAIVNCGVIKFSTASVFDGSVWSPSPMAAGTYGGLTLAISTTTASNDTWTLTPVAP